MTTTDSDDLKRLRAETDRLNAEADRLMAEVRKRTAEEMLRESTDIRYQVAASAALGAATVVITALLTLMVL